MKKVSVIFLGCPKNFIDTEAILATLYKGGFNLVNDLRAAEIAILTTCAFIKSARRETNRKIRKLIRLKKEGRLKKVVVFGCLVQQAKEKLLSQFPEIDHFVGLDYITKIPEMLKGKERIVYKLKPTYLAFDRFLQTKSYAYLKISEGCSNFCAYCQIPKIRGDYRSRPMEEILEEAKAIAQIGIKEIILVSQDSTLYGTDLYRSQKLHLLLKELTKIKGIEWLRLLYTHPAHFYPELLEIIKNEEKILKYIDFPLQHISDKILYLMGRGYLREDVERILDFLFRIPEMTIRTTFIVGFPKETEEDFRELLDFTKSVKFDHIGCFLYSRERFTPAYYLSPQIPYRVKKERQRLLLSCQKKISEEKLKSLIGKEMAVMVDRRVNGRRYSYLGRTYREAPEIDGSVLIRGNNLAIGKIYPMRIVAATAYDLYAEMAPRGFEPRSQG